MTRAEAWSVYFLTGDTALLEKTPVDEVVEQYACPSYFDDDNVLQSCECGRCE